MSFKSKLRTVLTFAKIDTRRVFRDRMALFFTFLFPLIFLFIFGGLNSGGDDLSFRVAVLNNSDTKIAEQLTEGLGKSEVFEIDDEANTLATANEKMVRGELDATIELPKGFGATAAGAATPSGEAIVHYTQNNTAAAQTLISVLDAQFKGINGEFVSTELPFTVKGERNNQHSLNAFDYTFAGLLGFTILGIGIFGPTAIFPELKKQGILRRLHTTPLRVWQYFLSTMLSQLATGLMSIALMFVVAIMVFDLQIAGNYLELAIYLVLGIIMILGIGLALGGWARNERQAAPLSNIITFPMMFLTGTFFPRYVMPEWLQAITTFIPLTPVIDGARLIATEGKHLIDLLPQLGLMAVWIVIIYVIAFRVFRWE